MATNPELEAVIETSPDEVDGYYVYGDWLESQNDPRGELIALQSALLRKPRDKALIKATNQYIEAHQKELLGDHLAKLTPDQLVIEWRLGFIHAVRIQKHKTEEVPRTLRALLDHPSGRFIQSLTIASVYGVPLMSPVDCVRLLLDAKKPTTLTELRIGGLAAWDVDKDSASAELRKTFPRLQRSIDVEWQSIMTTIGDPRKFELRYDPTKLPKLEPIEGVELGAVDNERVLAGLKLEIDKNRPLGLVVAMRRAFAPELLDRFALGLGEQFAAMGEGTPLRWGFLAMGLLGQDEAASWIAERLRRWSHQRSVQGAEMLGSIGSAIAIYELYGMVSDPNVNRPRRDAGETIIEKVAQDRGLTLESLLDRSVPFGAKSEQGLAQTVTTTTRRFLRHMIDGRRISLHEFRHYIAEHPIISPLAQRLVWASFDKRDAIVATFRIREDRVAVDVKDARLELGMGSESGSIGIPHPAEIEESKRAALLGSWEDAFKKAQIKPLFEQLNRPVFTLREQEKGHTITRFKFRKPGFDQIRNILEYQRDWHVSAQYDEGGVAAWGREMPRDQVFVQAGLVSGIEGVTVYKATERAFKASEKVSFRSLHPVTVSEILYDVDTATAVEAPNSKEAAAKAAAAEAASGVKKGDRVRIGLRGDQGKGQWGIVFWIGERAGALRCGIRADEGDETYWVEVGQLEKVTEEEREKSAAKAAKKKSGAKKASAKATSSSSKKKDSAVETTEEEEEEESAAPAKEPEGLKKGMRVRWKSGSNSGTGTVFWIGAGKFGGGPRAGVKDAETGETVWAAAADCEPIA